MKNKQEDCQCPCHWTAKEIEEKGLPAYLPCEHCKPAQEDWEKEFDKEFCDENRPNLLNGYQEAWKIKRFIKDLLQSQKKQIGEDLRKKLDVVMSKKRCEDLASTLEHFFNEPVCKICGTEPRRQREMLIKLLTEKG